MSSISTWSKGEYADVTDGAIAMRDTIASDLGLVVGDTAPVEIADGSVVELELVAMFSDGNIFEGALVTESRFDTIADQSSFDWVAATVSPGSTIDQANAAIDAIAAEFPQIDAQSAAEYRESISGQIDQLLQILGGFLGLAILIAFIGIVNTMALSIFERTRELGLLRAVGMTRTQMHRMVRWEAVIVSAAGLVAGFLPARRAGKLNVLDAISMG